MSDRLSMSLEKVDDDLEEIEKINKYVHEVFISQIKELRGDKLTVIMNFSSSRSERLYEN